MDHITALATSFAANCSSYSDGTITKDQVAALLLQSLELADHLYALNESLRVCPGAYWRGDAQVAARMSAKRARPGGAAGCGSTDKTRSFSQGYLGPALPPPEGGGGRRLPLCNTCGAKYHRDAEKQFVSK
jgi:hypothetical protein